jgi:hypothetical protein
MIRNVKSFELRSNFTRYLFFSCYIHLSLFQFFLLLLLNLVLILILIIVIIVVLFQIQSGVIAFHYFSMQKLIVCIRDFILNLNCLEFIIYRLDTFTLSEFIFVFLQNVTRVILICDWFFGKKNRLS